MFNYKIMMLVKSTGRLIDMPGMQNLGLFRAMHYADLYKKRNPSCNYHVINQENNDMEYSV